MEWRYGVTGADRAIGTIVEYFSGYGFAKCPEFSDRILIRDAEYMSPTGPYYIPADGIASGLRRNDVVEFLTLEVSSGLLGLRVRSIGTCILHEEVNFEEEDGSIGTKLLDPDYDGKGTDIWKQVEFPRLIGAIQQYFPERSFGFLRCDEIVDNSFFHKCELLVPYEKLQNPSSINRTVSKSDLVTFDSAETPRGMRALAIRPLKKEGTL